jgi:hypothetical protein
MSLIIHRCQRCTHPDFFHVAAQECSWGHCRAGRHAFLPGPSETMPTYDHAGKVTTTTVVPGSVYTGFGRGRIDTCGCGECLALYASRGLAVTS